MNIESTTLKFSGHQTFPIRYGWIYKIIQEVVKGESLSSKSNIEQQMQSMGMGKNMVLSVRHWIRALNLVICIDNKEQIYQLTPLAEQLFTDKNGHTAYDEYLDKIGTTWLLHWLLQSIEPTKAELNASRFFFNYFNGIKVKKDSLATEIKDALANHEKELTEATLNKDIDCLLQMYAHKSLQSSKINEDSFASPFTELALLKQEDAKSYLAELARRPSLPVEIFTYALIDYMKRKHQGSQVNTLSFDALLNDVGSPGRVFRLSSAGLSDKLDQVETLTDGNIAWTDTQGLRQVQHSFDSIDSIDPSLYLKHYYQPEEK
ncbi:MULTISPECIES: DUF4007 family protein [Vibrio harveyi group]|uniref:DUF4007 family protein n=1 Tax=Vibrio harveyi group TaxID=717610 RepID=UPI0009BC1561|nr:MULTISPECIES: DUF4007 family protein [Vibrio harveyi group]ELG2963909.1 DUF4007 family protein [Vibrio fluvialis]EGQ8406299.1 DUF4007 family protein [Vibrio parahaemolyticus]ELB2030327.1 DUF4007 family protein [Vibrio parahaemolyticus]ELB2141552.1 DUF4007 family protein [Vibrio parahaemolyticus]ELB2219377.1 DUF4007 family protein [Vibrio parahaemolyticus]